MPLAIRFLPKKDRELIGERVAFLGSDGVLVLNKLLEIKFSMVQKRPFEEIGLKLQYKNYIFKFRISENGCTVFKSIE